MLLAAVVLFGAGSAIYIYLPIGEEPVVNVDGRGTVEGKLTVHWGSLSEKRLETLRPTSGTSNIRPADYTGPEACRRCHKDKYKDWTGHAHRWMNALIEEKIVKGDFSGDAEIVYQGDRGTFFRDDGRWMMKIEHDQGESLYEIHQTLGSRFFQYYIGQGVEGPSPTGSAAYYELDHVLPFGYWLDRDMWVPIVHVQDEDPDENGRWNPLHGTAPGGTRPTDLVYHRRCNGCHTTFALADTMIRQPNLIGAFAPQELLLDMSSYLADSHPAVWDGNINPDRVADEEINAIVEQTVQFDAREKAIALGITCEACHLGARAHAEGKLKKPSFFAHGEALYVKGHGAEIESGRTHANVNWVCGRCHQGERPYFEAGMGTWNSTEFSDAQRGSCYSELTCVHCHDPHKGIGKRWAKTPAQDDASCLSCHSKFDDADTRLEHTHHPAGSSGDRCMNCHMPKINEGMQDAVRTHMIFSPTHRGMLEAAQPNACNLCHRDKPIDWTAKHLGEWYGQNFDQASIDEHYKPRNEAVGRIWLKHEHESVRLLAVDAYAKARDRSTLSDMIEVLDDPYLLNRQFTQKGLEDMLGIRLDEMGYRFYMTEEERGEPLKKVREALVPK